MDCRGIFCSEYHFWVVLVGGGRKHGFHLVFYRDIVARQLADCFNASARVCTSIGIRLLSKGGCSCSSAHAGVWWGALMTVIGAVYCYYFKPGQKKA